MTTVYVATLDTGGISYGGREFVAVAETIEAVEAALVQAVDQDGWVAGGYDRDEPIPHTFAGLRDYFGVKVTGPVEIGSGTRSDL